MDHPVIKAIEDRRSIRSFRAVPVTDEQVSLLETAALAAPSAVNYQPWHLSFVRQPALLDEINRTAVEAIGRDPAYNIFFHAPLVVLIAADTSRKWGVLDSGIAVQNIALAAHDLGLGSVIVGMAEAAFESPTGDALALRVGFPAGHRFAISIAIGVPAAGKPPHENQPNRITRID